MGYINISIICDEIATSLYEKPITIHDPALNEFRVRGEHKTYTRFLAKKVDINFLLDQIPRERIASYLMEIPNDAIS